jgi:hypothetical protein
MLITQTTFPTEVYPGCYLIQSFSQMILCAHFPGAFIITPEAEMLFIETLSLPQP